MPTDPENAPVDEAFIFGLPKAELHLHLEGAMEPELYLELAARNGIATDFETAEDVRERLRTATDMPSFIVIYEQLIDVIRTTEDFRDVALGYFRKAREQGVILAEVFFDPQLHLERGIEFSAICEGLAEARNQAGSELGLEASYIMCFLRDRPIEAALAVLEQSRPWLGELIIGIGLDNPEIRDFPAKFAPVFDRARELGFRLTTHCDVDQPNTVAHHWGALDLLKVERIDHGLNVLDDPALVEAVRERHIGLTAAPTLLPREIPGRMEYRAGAIRKLLELGLLVNLNSDDPGMKRGLYIGDLMLRAAQTAGMSRPQVVQLARNGFDMAWIDAETRSRYLARLDAYCGDPPASAA